MTRIDVGFVETMPVVAQLQNDRAALNLQRGIDRFASRMSRDVVDAFFENQKDLATRFGIDLHFVIGIRRVEVKLDVARGQAVAGKAAHPVRQIDEVIAFGVDCPDDVAHGLD